MIEPTAKTPRGNHCELPAKTSPSCQEVECEDCGLDPICVVLDYSEEQSGVPEGVLLRRRPVRRGETIFRKDDPFHSIFAVKSGAFKSYIPKKDCADQIVGFNLVGELIGTEGLATLSYPYTARSLEDSSVCELRVSRLPESGRSIESLQRAVINLLGNEVAFNHHVISHLVHQSADQRIAGFLISLSQRLEYRGMPKMAFRLSMSRSDIGNYLGLASETVSRTFTRFQRSGYIRLDKRRLRIMDEQSLAEISSG